MQKNFFSLTIFHFPIFKIHFFKESLVMDSAFFCRCKWHINTCELAANKKRTRCRVLFRIVGGEVISSIPPPTP